MVSEYFFTKNSFWGEGWGALFYKLTRKNPNLTKKSFLFFLFVWGAGGGGAGKGSGRISVRA